MKITTVGIDLAKSVFQVHGVSERGKALLRKQLKRSEMLKFFTDLPPCLIGMEACGSAHHWARKLIDQEIIVLCVRCDPLAISERHSPSRPQVVDEELRRRR